jgi:hypothetical protein
LSDQVYGSPSRHPEVRRDVCDWIERWAERYEGFVEFEDEDEGGEEDKAPVQPHGREKKSKRLERYLTGMRENGGSLFSFPSCFLVSVF